MGKGIIFLLCFGLLFSCENKNFVNEKRELFVPYKDIDIFTLKENIKMDASLSPCLEIMRDSDKIYVIENQYGEREYTYQKRKNFWYTCTLDENPDRPHDTLKCERYITHDVIFQFEYTKWRQNEPELLLFKIMNRDSIIIYHLGGEQRLISTLSTQIPYFEIEKIIKEKEGKAIIYTLGKKIKSKFYYTKKEQWDKKISIIEYESNTLLDGFSYYWDIYRRPHLRGKEISKKEISL